MSIFLVEHAGQGYVAGGTMVSKICHMAPDGCQCTRHGVSCGSVVDLFDFDSILLISEEETDEGGCGALLWGCSGG